MTGLTKENIREEKKQAQAVLPFSNVVKRDGSYQNYNADKIAYAIERAFVAGNFPISQQKIQDLVANVEKSLQKQKQNSLHIERIQDGIEEVLMKNNHFQIAKRFIIYRQKRAEERHSKILQKQENIQSFSVKKHNDTLNSFDTEKILKTLKRVSKDIDTDALPLDLITTELEKNIFDGISTEELEEALILSTIAFIERDPGYDLIAKRLLLQKIYKEVKLAHVVQKDSQPNESLQKAFLEAIPLGVERGYYSKKLLDFDLAKLASSLQIKRDEEFKYLGLCTLYDRYLLSHQGKCVETPQIFWMRIAMGLSATEKDKNKHAREFYQLISNMYYVPSTPTLFHAGLVRPQLSSCYISTISDNLSNIFKCIGDNAQIAKWSGGLGNDWTPVRATNAHIKSTNVDSQGIVPFLKIANDTTLAINRSGKRRGATCSYLETWHLDIEDYIDLRRNTGDDRRRTHDMNTAVWVPDLFMKRVQADQEWTLFSPNDVPDLHDSYGKDFENRYLHYEEELQNGKLDHYKKIDAMKLWRKILTRLFETGHPWITFKDPCNIRSPQDHAGVIHSSNLCTEITLNTSPEETAVCNLGSVNLKKHCDADGLNQYQLASSIKTAMRMLDNVIDINFYPTAEAKTSNMKHRPVGLGLMGLQDALFMLKLPFDDTKAIEFVDSTMEFISYNAILASSELAKERGPYKSYPGSKWSRDLLPYDTIKLLENERGEKIEVNRESRLNWTPVREHIREHGMRNSNTVAIAPTATISNIAGCFPCIEPIYKNIYVKSNMSGEFTIVNQYLVQELKQLGLWYPKMREQIKYYDGNIDYIEEIPLEIRNLYKEIFDIDPNSLLRLSAVRSKWIDQSQSHNVFIKGASGKKLHDTYFAAWKMGLKTTYYLRTLAATQIEKSTLDAKEYGYTQKRSYHTPLSSTESKQEDEKVSAEVIQELQSAPSVAAAAKEDLGSTTQRKQSFLSPSAKFSQDKEGKSPSVDGNFQLDKNTQGNSITSNEICSILEPDCESCQ